MTNTKVGMVSSVHGKIDREALALRRREGIRWHQKGKSQYWIAQKLGVSFEAVSNWVEAYEADGMKGLRSLGNPGEADAHGGRQEENQGRSRERLEGGRLRNRPLDARADCKGHPHENKEAIQDNPYLAHRDIPRVLLPEARTQGKGAG